MSAPPPWPSWVPGPPVPVPAPRTSGMATASLVLGILWIGGLGSCLAVLLGYAALDDIAVTTKSGRGLAIAGLILGWVGVGLTALVFLSR